MSPNGLRSISAWSLLLDIARAALGMTRKIQRGVPAEIAYVEEKFFKKSRISPRSKRSRISLKINHLGVAWLEKACCIGVFKQKKANLQHISVDVIGDF